MNMIYKTQGKVSGNWQREFDQDDWIKSENRLSYSLGTERKNCVSVASILNIYAGGLMLWKAAQELPRKKFKVVMLK